MDQGTDSWSYGTGELSKRAGQQGAFPTSVQHCPAAHGSPLGQSESGQVSLGQRWLKILWKMWKTKRRYDPEPHQRNQLKHGGWVISLLPAGRA